jgi:hypothetical protein
MLRMESLTKKITSNDKNNIHTNNSNSTLNPIKSVKNTSGIGICKNSVANSEKTNKYSKGESNFSMSHDYNNSKHNSQKKKEAKIKNSFESKNRKNIKITGTLNIVKYGTMDSGSGKQSNLDSDGGYLGTIENDQTQNTICTNIDEYDLDYGGLGNHQLDYEIEQHQFNNKKQRNYNLSNYNAATNKSNMSHDLSRYSFLGDDDNDKPKSPNYNDRLGKPINYNNYNQLQHYTNFNNNFSNNNNDDSQISRNNMLGDSVFGTNLSNYYNRVKGKELKDYPNETENTQKDILLGENFNTTQTNNRSFQYSTTQSNNKISNVLNRLGENEYDLMGNNNLQNNRNVQTDQKIYSKKAVPKNFSRNESIRKKGEIYEINDKRHSDKSIDNDVEYSYEYAQSNDMNHDICGISPMNKSNSDKSEERKKIEKGTHLVNKHSIFSTFSDIGMDDDGNKSLCNMSVASINNEFNEDLKLQQNKKFDNNTMFFSKNNNDTCNNNDFINFGDGYDDEDFNPK